jgi:hypothetical protein
MSKNNKVHIVNSVDEGRRKLLESFPYGFQGTYEIQITNEHIQALLQGKTLAVNPDDEYDVYIVKVSGKTT